MAAVEHPLHAGEADEDALIDAYVEIDPRRSGAGEARLATYGFPIWILIDALVATDHDVLRVARNYEIPEEAVRAAIAFYRRHPDAIDARARANAAFFLANA